MPGPDNIPTREQLYDMIGRASLFGYLGLFVGTGFSRAATGSAPSFEELIRTLIERLGLSVDLDSDPAYHRKSLPQIASILVKELATSTTPPERAVERLKEEVARICNLVPYHASRERFVVALKSLRPSWVITTNYDLVLEMLLEGSVSVLPDQPLVARSDWVPVYHLHGHRLNPASIKLTEEDYVGLLGPIDYQRLKLPLIFLESTTVMLGYSLGDINVRAAMAWASSFRGPQGVRLSSGQGAVIQALYVSDRAILLEPYSGPNGEWILEISDIASFLKDLADHRERLSSSLADAQRDIENFLSDPSMASAVAGQGAERDRFLQIFQAALPFAQATPFIDFLNRALDPVWERARENQGFAHYVTYLNLLIDILSRIEVGQGNPALLSYLADGLDRVGWYIDPLEAYGSAWGATRTWLSDHARINDGIKLELKSYAETNQKSGLEKMLKHIGL